MIDNGRVIGWASLVVQTVKNLPAMQETQVRSPGSGRFPWRKKWQLTSVLLPGESHGQRGLVGYSPWGCKESDMTEWLTLSLFMWDWTKVTLTFTLARAGCIPEQFRSHSWFRSRGGRRGEWRGCRKGSVLTGSSTELGERIHGCYVDSVVSNFLRPYGQ